MGYNIAFYVHHHGSGHLMRALAIAAHLDQPVTFLGSGLREHQNIIPPEIECVHLPLDVPGEKDIAHDKGTHVDCLHYAPLNVLGVRLRNQLMCDFFARSYPMLLVVDVSVEVALLARLSGVPVIVVRQHGARNDPAHLAAYQSAALLLAPYPGALRSASFKWIDEKTFFTGGFSKYTGSKTATQLSENEKSVAVMSGTGGTSINLAFMRHLASVCPDHDFHILGNSYPPQWPAKNITFHGFYAQPENIINSCSLVIGNAGHNTVMEVADLNKDFICIPEERPFNEQLEKALLIQHHYGVTLVMPDQLFTADWKTLLDKNSHSRPEWQGMINDEALEQAAGAIHQVACRYF